MNVDFCLARMESLFVVLCHNMSKKSVATAIVPEGIIIFVVLYGSICIFYDN
jgi:multisubunit Na+/H+ antiporter MnhC subunit